MGNAAVASNHCYGTRSSKKVSKEAVKNILHESQNPVVWLSITSSYQVHAASGEGGSKPVSRCASLEGMGLALDSPVASSADDPPAADGSSHPEPCRDAPVNGKRHGK